MLPVGGNFETPYKSLSPFTPWGFSNLMCMVIFLQASKLIEQICYLLDMVGWFGFFLGQETLCSVAAASTSWNRSSV